jgi:hypothetical protein
MPTPVAKPTVRHAPDDGDRAPGHDRCAKDEARQVAAQPTWPQGRGELCSTLVKVGRLVRLTDDEAGVLDRARDAIPACAVDFD